MSMLTKNLLAGAIVASFALTGAVIAEEEITHKTIEIKAVKHQDVSVWVDSDGDSQTLVFSPSEIQDTKVMASKLESLDPETRQTVMQALQGVRHINTGEREVQKVYVMNKGEGQRVEFIGPDSDVEMEIVSGGEHKIIRRHFIHEDGGEAILKGHTSVIASLIERGEFSQDDLDKIQAALDAKR
jgi:hypothetical protein